MFLFITAIGILAATAALCALLAVRPPSKATGRAANAAGVIGAFAGCFVGLCALASGPWAGQESLRLPLAWGLQPLWGQDALWWSFPLSALASMLLSIAYYRWGPWRRSRLLDSPTEQS